MAEAAFFFLVVLFGIGGTLLLYLLIADETSDAETMDRADAESYARDRAAERYRGDDARDDRR